ncbi:MAG: carboxypeptidase-like regulatory domain-containing protein, partial [Tannerella sp.]|nr:carboxypeptidase-like regulatory domain-containing protein [Tannerella sp.]
MKSGLFLFCCLFSIAIYGQRTVSGHVTDASENVPAPGVTVFLSNTSVATVTDADGFYRLSIPGEGRYTLMVSHVAYQPVTKDIEPGNASLKFDVALQPRELDEVTIAKKIRFRKTDINIFYESILGEKPSQKTIWVSNPETVYYFYNESTGKLTVTCREPLQIINQKTGYQIRFILNYFTYDYRTGVADWSHRSSFTALEPENLIQKNKWEANRRKVYNISLAKFIKSLYNNKNSSLYGDGFALASARPNADPKEPYVISPLNPDMITVESNSGDSRKLNATTGPMLLICYGR